jgi:hypothetical protein
MTDVLEQVFADSPVIEPVVEEVAPIVVEPVIEPVIEQQTEKQSGMVPIAALLDERDRRKAAEARIPLAEPQSVSVPDPYDQPEEFAKFQDQKLGQALIAQKFEISDVMARQTHGAEVVDAAATWAEEKARNDPTFANAYMKQPHPLDWIVQQHKRDGLVSQLPTDISSIDEWIEREIAKRGLTAPTAPIGVQPVLKSAEPPRSIASDASPASNVVVDPDAEFNAIFNKR